MMGIEFFNDCREAILQMMKEAGTDSAAEGIALFSELNAWDQSVRMTRVLREYMQKQMNGNDDGY